MNSQTSLAWVDQYIGIPWRRGAQGPKAFDCWAFLRHVQKHHFGHDVPPVDVANLTPEKAQEAVRRWRRITRPIHGAGVFMTKPGADHVGVYLDYAGGRVLHCMEGLGVVLSDIPSLRLLGFGYLKYYAWADA